MAPYIEVFFRPVSSVQQEILIALLDACGFEGFEEGDDYLKAFIPKPCFEQLNWTEILSNAPALKDLKFSIKEIQPTNWNEAWEQSFQPIVVDHQLYIRASFHAPRKDIPLEIIIDPKMSFGTGHHATTYMMSKLMMQIDFKNKTVFDFGSGTGILSILAAKLNALSVFALDNEEWAYHNCMENCQLNEVNNVTVVLGDERRFPSASFFDIILANINKNVIAKNISSLCSIIKPGGLLLISGFLQQDVNALLRLAWKHHMMLLIQKEKDGWVCMKLKKPQNAYDIIRENYG
jgi:ribosomal protein L11 methyltransferase